MQRFFVDKSVINADKITISGDDAAHISRVLRLGAGDEIVVCDGLFTDYFCEIESVSKSEVALHIKHTEKNNNEPTVTINEFEQCFAETKPEEREGMVKNFKSFYKALSKEQRKEVARNNEEKSR